jgi:RHS repeat-associated protein
VQGKAFYYARDHLGSVRDVVDVKTGQDLQSYDYDPYGRDITAGLEYPAYSTDFRYAGMFYHQPSGLYLTRYRVYDPRYGRWLSRDPLGEFSHIGDPPDPERAVRIMPGLSSTSSVFYRFQTAALPQPTASPGNFYTSSANLYAYVGGNPVMYTDPNGLDYASCFHECTSYFFGNSDLFPLISIIPGVNVGYVSGAYVGCTLRCGHETNRFDGCTASGGVPGAAGPVSSGGPAKAGISPILIPEIVIEGDPKAGISPILIPEIVIRE